MTVQPPEGDTQPADGPATLQGVKEWLTLKDNLEDGRLTVIVAAVNDVVRALPVAHDVGDAWPARVVTGATMLAARLHKRRGSPAGVEVFGAQGALYVRRNDPDIGMLLQLGEHGKPAIA